MPNHFATVANDYAKYRPGYPAALYQWLQTLVDSHALCWDVGCGNGQASVALADIAASIVASDISLEQLRCAKAHSRVHYLLARAERAPLADHCIDVITVAQALHWFDLQAFNREVNRVLRHGGWLVVWTYQPIRARDENIQRHIDRFYQSQAQPWWPPGREHVDNGYRDLVLPFDDVHVQEWTMEQVMTRAEFCGYVRTWSAMAKQRAATGVDAVLDLDRELSPLWPTDTGQTLYWPLRLRAAQRD